jgi:hypothetical protein
MTARDRTVIVVLVVIAAIVACWFEVIQPKRSEASKLGGQITAAQSELAQAQAQVAAGESAKKAYPSYYTALAKLGEAVPSDDDVPSLIYQLQAAANVSKVGFEDVVLTPAGSSAPPPAPSTGATGATGTTGAVGALSATTLPPGAVVGPAGLPIEPFTLTFQGNYFHLADFLGRIEKFVTSNNSTILVHGRLMTLNAINVGPAPSGFPQISVSINATTYLAPTQPSLPNASATPSTPVSSTSSPSTSSNTSFPTAAISVR